jgi:hypothetical protein
MSASSRMAEAARRLLPALLLFAVVAGLVPPSPARAFR